MSKFTKKISKAFRKYTPAGLVHKGLNHVRHKIGLDAKHIKSKLFPSVALSSGAALNSSKRLSEMM